MSWLGDAHVDHEHIRSLLDEIDESGSNLSDWEREFVADMIDRDQRRFSEAQALRIEQIWEERC